MTLKQLLELFVNVRNRYDGYNNYDSLWNQLIDNLGVASEKSSDFIAGSPFTISKKIGATSPESLKVLLTCFADSELKYLPFYLRDSHYKQMAQKMAKISDSSSRQVAMAANLDFNGIPYSYLYSYCLIEPFSNYNVYQAQATQYYQKFLPLSDDYSSKIAVKIPSSYEGKSVARYSSWSEYLSEKKLKEMSRHPQDKDLPKSKEDSQMLNISAIDKGLNLNKIITSQILIKEPSTNPLHINSTGINSSKNTESQK